MVVFQKTMSLKKAQKQWGKLMKEQLVFVLVFVLAGPAFSECSSSQEGIEGVTGIIAMTPVTESSCLSVWVPVGEGCALAGFRWFNNDGTVPFPFVLVESGEPESPVALLDAYIVAETVYGQSSGWSEVMFAEPIGATGEGLYTILLMPSEGEFEFEGSGGGTGVGYVEGVGGLRGWLCIDGEQWIAIHEDFGIAFEPIFVDEEPWMLQKSGGRKLQGENHIPKITALHLPYPNPFNPETRISFSLSQESVVDISIFDVRGLLVRNFPKRSFCSGRHYLTWDGQDNNNRSSVSGVYLIRMKTDEYESIERAVLIK